MKRREFITYSLIASALLFGCGGNKGSNGNSGSFSNHNNDDKSVPNNPSLTSSKKELPIPKLLGGELRDGVVHYDISVNQAKHSFFEGVETSTYAFNDNTYLGPTIRLRNGDKVSINFTNKLNEKTTVHSHGMHVPASMDGGVHQIIEPNQTWSAIYTVNQNACTNWYHPHLMGETARQVYMGLAGLIIVEDDVSDSLQLPKTYGVDDIPLILQDRFFDADKELDYSPSMMQVMRGYVGDTNITNGIIEPVVKLPNKEVRFRILNGSNSSVYELVFSDKRAFSQIATDNSFLNSPVTLTSLRLSPAERAEIVVDLSNVLGNTLYLIDQNSGKNFLQIDVSKTSDLTTSLPKRLTTLDILDPNSVQNRRSFRLSGRRGQFTINGVSMDKSLINERVPIDQVEIWEVTNEMMMHHNFHIHASHFYIIERNGSSENVPENEKGFKDTVYIPAGESVKFIVKMIDYTDDKNPYMYHCHFLEHEDAGMMGQFVVI